MCNAASQGVLSRRRSQALLPCCLAALLLGLHLCSPRHSAPPQFGCRCWPSVGAVCRKHAYGLVAELQEGLEDRAYRLHYNMGQRRTDRFAQVGPRQQGACLAGAQTDRCNCVLPAVAWLRDSTVAS